MNKKILGLIPARGGSKGIPNKNIIDLNGKPLIEYSIAAANHSQYLSNVVVSTDSAEIADIAQDLGANVPFMRPVELSGDSSSAVEVIKHAIDYFKTTGHSFDYIVYLQPTSPLRTKNDIDSSIDIMLRSDADSLVSVVDVPHQFGIESLMTEKATPQGQRLSPAIESKQPLSQQKPGKQTLNRQEKSQYVARNGPAILVTRPETITQFNNLYGNKIASYKMPTNRSADIDSAEDLDYVSWLMERY